MTEAGGEELGRSVLVTGASRGIGRAIASTLARAGNRVAVSARSVGVLDTLAFELGGRSVPCDVTDADAVEGMRQQVVAWAGGAPDVIVAAAGVFTLAPVGSTTEEDLAANLSVNLAGTVRVVRAFLPAMLTRGSGRIVTIGSVAGRRAFPGNGAYSASKFGLRGFHEVLLEEVRGTGVAATLVEPGAVDTTIWDRIDRESNPGLPERAAMLDPIHVAEAVRFVVDQEPDVRIPYLPIEPA